MRQLHRVNVTVNAGDDHDGMTTSAVMTPRELASLEGKIQKHMDAARAKRSAEAEQLREKLAELGEPNEVS